MSFLLRNIDGDIDSDAESSSDEDEEYEHEDESGDQHQPSADLPIRFLGVYIRRHHHNCSTTSDTEKGTSLLRLIRMMMSRQRAWLQQPAPRQNAHLLLQRHRPPLGGAAKKNNK